MKNQLYIRGIINSNPSFYFLYEYFSLLINIKNVFLIYLDRALCVFDSITRSEKCQ